MGDCNVLLVTNNISPGYLERTTTIIVWDADLRTPDLGSSFNNAVQITKTDLREFLIGFSAFFGCFIRTIKMFQA